MRHRHRFDPPLGSELVVDGNCSIGLDRSTGGDIGRQPRKRLAPVRVVLVDPCLVEVVVVIIHRHVMDDGVFNRRTLI